MFDKCRTVKPVYWPGLAAGGIRWRAAHYQPERRDAKFCPIAKKHSARLRSWDGAVNLAWLSLNQYVQLPAPIASPTAALVMLFAGIVLMIPPPSSWMWRMAQIGPQQLTHSKA
ncbi:DUF1418 family protein [Klebsiella pneumoniae subsp. pneumoniae]|nr:DUF1418 family protein [Klebsiella pneumoniae subsp. pneumoniae]